MKPSVYYKLIYACDHPIKLMKLLWPGHKFYHEQREMIEGVRDSIETYVIAGNQLGKDFTAAAIAITFFLRPQVYFPQEYVWRIDREKSPSNPYPHTRRIVTTSVRDDHLDVLWGEIGRFIKGSSLPLMHQDGGPLVVNHHEIRLAREMDTKNPTNYLQGIVAKQGEGMAGHHAAYTLCICDEASGIPDVTYRMQQGWAKRLLAFGNPNDCQNWWREGIKLGDMLAADATTIPQAKAG